MLSEPCVSHTSVLSLPVASWKSSGTKQRQTRRVLELEVTGTAQGEPELPLELSTVPEAEIGDQARAATPRTLTRSLENVCMEQLTTRAKPLLCSWKPMGNMTNTRPSLLEHSVWVESDEK